VFPEGSTSPAGEVTVFASSHEGEEIYEIGWMILPEFHNRGLAGRAVREVIAKARADGRSTLEAVILAKRRVPRRWPKRIAAGQRPFSMGM
jgi:RimJ/RimL family protein N-acetyltransferase